MTRFVMIRLLFNIQSIKHEETDRLYQTVLEDGCLIMPFLKRRADKKCKYIFFILLNFFFFTFWMSSLS